MPDDSPDTAPPSAAPTTWLLRIPLVFADLVPDVLLALDATLKKHISTEYYWVLLRNAAVLRRSPAMAFVSWHMPLDHAWPVNPGKMEGFVEKAVHSLVTKFAGRQPQGAFVGTLNTRAIDQYFRKLASNLRGRMLQVMPPMSVDLPEDQAPGSPSLFALVGREGIYAGVISPRQSGGFYPGGSKFIKTSNDDSISRAGAKIAEALHILSLYRPIPPEGARWLDLGAAPGGITAELLQRHYRVTAVDSAPLDERLLKRPLLTFFETSLIDFKPSIRAQYDAVVCDLNNDPATAIGHVARLSTNVKAGGIVVFVLKLAGAEAYDAILSLLSTTIESARAASLHVIAVKHLTYNRHELTIFLEKKS